ncbi:DUF350 domain-containing protein [Candidatus Micrarchaeota archaeon]|nr:DUF350 domain-containing protein [Candidatus Micrarchaeota archaeon]
MDGLGVQIIVSGFQFIIGLLLSVVAVYASLKLFDRFTYHLDEWKEFKKGNIAVGILLGAIIISISIIVESGVTAVTSKIVFNTTFNYLILSVLIGLMNLVISVFAALIAIYFAIRILDWMTDDINEMEELRKGNVAVAIMMAAVLISVSFVVRGAVSSITGMVSVVDIIDVLGL